MPSAWIERRGSSWRVRYRIGGRESPKLFGGSFKRKADAETRRRFIDGELAALRVPDLRLLAAAPKSPTLLEAEHGRYTASR
jgi:hypothetical protein